eukprot:TRINITY_DN5414_c0_g1_i1.p1 TRINITY_DN5414_c0_g1~~TRINITY_DN5414_c0_g1_i1.p1  ORF type:complete len:541 (+),score=177.55 TRINITY_DN5414_c0_g1_i1:166-1623(+)
MEYGRGLEFGVAEEVEGELYVKGRHAYGFRSLGAATVKKPLQPSATVEIVGNLDVWDVRSGARMSCGSLTWSATENVLKMQEGVSGSRKGCYNCSTPQIIVSRNKEIIRGVDKELLLPAVKWEQRTEEKTRSALREKELEDEIGVALPRGKVVVEGPLKGWVRTPAPDFSAPFQGIKKLVEVDRSGIANIIEEIRKGRKGGSRGSRKGRKDMEEGRGGGGLLSLPGLAVASVLSVPLLPFRLLGHVLPFMRKKSVAEEVAERVLWECSEAVAIPWEEKVRVQESSGKRKEVKMEVLAQGGIQWALHSGVASAPLGLSSFSPDLNSSIEAGEAVLKVDASQASLGKGVKANVRKFHLESPEILWKKLPPWESFSSYLAKLRKSPVLLDKSGKKSASELIPWKADRQEVPPRQAGRLPGHHLVHLARDALSLAVAGAVGLGRGFVTGEVGKEISRSWQQMRRRRSSRGAVNKWIMVAEGGTRITLKN